MTENQSGNLGRFRLRTLFVIVTVVGVWLAWQVSAVRSRQQLIREMRTNSAFTIIEAETKNPQPPGQAAPQGKHGRISWLRRLLGDRPVAQIVYAPYQRGFSKAQLQRLQSAFAEAEVIKENPPEPCHPGCFPHGTLVETPGGPRTIESIQPGEWVLAVTADGSTRNKNVESIFRTSNWLWSISTEEGDFLTTETQPLCLSLNKTIAAGKLRAGDRILAWRDGRPLPVTVLEAAPTGRKASVVNLVLGDSQYFIANGWMARSKPPGQRQYLPELATLVAPANLSAQARPLDERSFANAGFRSYEREDSVGAEQSAVSNREKTSE